MHMHLYGCTEEFDVWTFTVCMPFYNIYAVAKLILWSIGQSDEYFIIYKCGSIRSVRSSILVYGRTCVCVCARCAWMRVWKVWRRELQHVYEERMEMCIETEIG